MIKFNEKTLSKLKTADELFDEKYGKKGTKSREEFEIKSLAWYYGEVLRNKRQELNLTQKALADMVGKKREYVAALERGKTDMQVSTLLSISNALGLKFQLI